MSTVINRKKVLDEIKNIPEHLLGDLHNYIQYLKNKRIKKTELDKTQTYLASQDLLGKEWLLKEEDEAWKDL